MHDIETVGEPASRGDVAVKATRSLEELQDGLAKARIEGREAEYLASPASENGLGIFSQVLPTAALQKLDLLANTLDGIRWTKRTRSAMRWAMQRMPSPRRCGRRVRHEVWRSLIREFREDGELAALVGIARGAGNLDLMLGIGELSPREIGELLKLDPTAYRQGLAGLAPASGEPSKTAGGVGFEEALDASIRDIELSTLGPREAAHSPKRS